MRISLEDFRKIESMINAGNPVEDCFDIEKIAEWLIEERKLNYELEEHKSMNEWLYWKK